MICLTSLGCRQKLNIPINSITWDSRGFKIDGKYTLFNIGGLMYWRTPPGEWEDRLKKMKGSGINMVETYVSWVFHEPEEGEFDFSSETHDLSRFLTLCEDIGLFVYIRPGPYINAEDDGGGLPGWLIRNAGKDPAAAADGKVVPRRDDADYNSYVARYLGQLDRIVKNHEYGTTGRGTVLFYALENEYEWFQFNRLLEGTQIKLAEVSRIFTFLRDTVRGHGITIPLVVASGVPPGDTAFIGTGGVPGILVAPNMYPGNATIKPGGNAPFDIEGTGAEAIKQLHSYSFNKGLYAGTPSFITETQQRVSTIQRFIMSGMEGANIYNYCGLAVEGYQNGDHFERDGNTNTVAYFGSQIGYGGPVSPRGILRSTYYSTRRKMGYFNSVSEPLASCGGANKDGPVTVNHPDIGTWSEGSRHIYWLMTETGTIFLGLLNEGHYDPITDTTIAPVDIKIPVRGVRVSEVVFPNYSDMTVPAESVAVPADGKVYSERFNDMMIAVRLPLGQGYPVLEYETSEITAIRDYHGRRLLVMAGAEGTWGEFRLSGLKGTPLEIKGNTLADVVVDENDGTTFTVHYRHAADGFLVLGLERGKILEVMITTIDRANRIWFAGAGGKEYLVEGVEYLEKSGSGAQGLEMVVHRSAGTFLVTLLLPSSPTGVEDEESGGAVTGWTYDPVTWALSYTVPVSYTLPTLPSVNTGRWTTEPLPSWPEAMSTWNGQPQALEKLGINRGHAWYLARFTLGAVPTGATIRVDAGSDMISAYVNGTYVGTVLPTNKAVKIAVTGSVLIAGNNELIFRVQIWGHNIFHIPQLPGIIDVPVAAIDSLRGLQGDAVVDTGASIVDIAEWGVVQYLRGEREGYISNKYNDGAWTVLGQPMTAGTPFTIPDGGTAWFRTTFQGNEMPDPAAIYAPVVITLSGKNVLGTIWLNERLIGRWLSDNDWLLKGVDTSVPGVATRAIRDMWMDKPGAADQFYMPGSLISQGTNTLAISFEDMSNADGEPSPDDGIMTGLEIRYNTDHLDGSIGSLKKSFLAIGIP